MNTRDFIKFRVFRPLLLKTGRWMGRYSKVGDHPVFDNRLFSWTAMLEKNWLTIRQELEAVLANHHLFPSLQEIQTEQKVLNQDHNWKTYFLYGFGQRAERNCQSCPATTALLEQIPEMKTAFFSILSAGKHIPAHRGVFKGLIRAHLGLIIPGRTGDCRMRIEKQEICWQEGKLYVFDDTYDHEVWNNTAETRVVLLFDVVRPYPFPFSAINRGIIRLISSSSFVKKALSNYADWEAKYYSITDGG